MNKYYQGVTLILLSAFGFGLMPIFALFIYQENVTVTTLLFLRFALAAAAFFSYLFFKKSPFCITRKNIAYLFILGSILYTMQSSLYFSAVKYISASFAVLLLYTYPIFVAVLTSLIEKEKLTGQIILAISVSIAGLIMVLGISFNGINHYGVVLALGSAVVYSVYIVLGNRVVKDLPPVAASAFIALFSSFSLLLMGLYTNSLIFNLTAKAGMAIAGIVSISTIMAMFTFFCGLELIGSTKASTLSMVEPIITILFSAFFFGERLSLLQLIGTLAVIAGAILAVSLREQQKTAPESSSAQF